MSRRVGHSTGGIKRPRYAGNTRGGSAAAGGGVNEIQINTETLKDLLDMLRTRPIFDVASRSFLSMVLGEAFTFSIPAIGLISNKEMEKVIQAFWMPWLRQVYLTCKLLGICPYYFEKTVDGMHNIPIVPDLDMGYITVSVTEAHKINYKFYWSHGIQPEEETNMLWILTENKPTMAGELRSPLVALLPNYRSLCKLQRAQDIAATQSAKPVHVMEYTPSSRTATDDNLAHLPADFGGAAGITRARRDAIREHEIRTRTNNLYRSMREANAQNLQQSTTQATLWTDSPMDVMEEMDAGFANRVIALREGYKYTQSAKPTLVGDYYAAEASFNIIAAAVMDFALELLQATSSSRAQNVEGAARFENDRVKEQTNFFITVLKSALVIAYREQFTQVMEDARNWRITRLKGDPGNVAYLYPELDVEIDLSSSTVISYDELRAMLYDGLITQDTFGHHALKSKNMPMEQYAGKDWPDNVPRERLIKPETDNADKKTAAPPRKKIKK
jgi:hypothetical protein